MYCYFRGREGEDKPSASRIHMMEFENISEEPTIGFGISAVKDDVRSRNRHLTCRRIEFSRYLLLPRCLIGAERSDTSLKFSPGFSSRCLGFQFLAKYLGRA
jgi:hypothetical protein